MSAVEPGSERSRGNATTRLLLPVVLAVGVLLGLGAFTFVYGEGYAYLSDDPGACATCHIMQGHFDAWIGSSHRRVATCNDCHLRHDFVGKWMTKADNGFFHSVAFTTGVFPEPIRIKPRNRRVTQAACLECHGELVHALGPPEPGGPGGGEALCVHCHRDVGHAQR